VGIIFTYLIPWSLVLLEKPPVTHLFKHIPTFHGTIKCINTLHMNPPLGSILSQMNPVHKTPPNSSTVHLNFILPNYVEQVL
jgi:hypothetical protein